MILTLILSTTKLTPDKVLQAMESIHIADVNALVKRSFWSIYVVEKKIGFFYFIKLHKSCMNYKRDRMGQDQPPTI